MRNMYRLLLPQHVNGIDKFVEEVEAHIKTTALNNVQSITGDNVIHVFSHVVT